MIVGSFVAWFSPWQLSVLVGWDVGAIVLLTWIGLTVGRLGPEATAAFARREDNSRGSTRALLVAASLVSLPGVGFALAASHDLESPFDGLLTAAVVVTVASSWALVHTTYMLRYADLYFTGVPGGVDFPDEDEPDFSDFAYLAGTVGMTFQVSDTDIQSRDMRRTVFRHALLSYLFGAVIVGVTINVVASLFH
ncbi:MAG: DUF1345 domain-containing protein [Pseudonocardiales bacterium]|nr:DUF1345 domain-containing protein [Pseudonocardiales bacterium]